MTKKRILLIDDNVVWTKLLAFHLEQSGRYMVKVENKPEKVLTKASVFKPHLVLCDVDMPGCDGGEVASRLQELPTPIPLIFLTGLVVQEESQKGEKMLGGFKFLPKTSGLPEILAYVDNFLSAQAPR